jgi:hypothetical protein
MPKYGITLFAIILLGCNYQIKFDKVKWQQHEDAGQPSAYRKSMLKDLITNYKLIGMKYPEVVELLGEPNFKDSSSFGYNIVVDYGYDIDPVYTKTLDFTLSKNFTITSFKVDEWKEQ